MAYRSSEVRLFQKRFGEIVRRRREALGISQEELADRCGLHRTYVSMIERGIKSASLRSLLALSRALSRPPHLLLKETEERLG